MPHLEIIWSENARFCLQKCYDFLSQYNKEVANKMLDNLILKLDILLSHPEIGRPNLEFNSYTRQLFIPFGSNGYVVLYQFVKNQNKIIILAVKHALELKFSFKN